MAQNEMVNMKPGSSAAAEPFQLVHLPLFPLFYQTPPPLPQ